MKQVTTFCRLKTHSQSVLNATNNLRIKQRILCFSATNNVSHSKYPRHYSLVYTDGMELNRITYQGMHFDNNIQHQSLVMSSDITHVSQMIYITTRFHL